MKKPDTPRFDHLWHEALVAQASLERHARLVGHHVREFRRSAYRFAKAVLDMRTQWPNELRDMVLSEKLDLAAWLDRSFEVIEAMGDTRERIWAAIEAGVTEREYVAQGEIAIVKKRIKVPQEIRDDGVIPQARPAGKSKEELADHYRDLYESIKSKYQGARDELRRLRHDNAILLRRVEQLERVVARAEKNLQAALETRARDPRRRQAEVST